MVRSVFLTLSFGLVSMLAWPLATATATDCFDYGKTNAVVGFGPTGFGFTEFVVDGDIAYVYKDNLATVHALDISDISSPQVIGSAVIGGNGSYLRREGDRLYAALEDGLAILDISQPGAPALLGSIALPHVFGIAPAGDVVYAAGDWHSFMVVDVSDPSHPFVLSELSIPQHGVRAVAVDGTHAYVNLLDEGLRVVDVSDPAAPQLLSTTPFGDPIRQVLVKDGLVWLNRGTLGLAAYDCSDPQFPTLVGEWNAGVWCFDVHLRGDRAIVCDPDTGLYVLDISDPAHIREVNALADIVDPYRAVDRGDLVFVNEHGRGLAAVDVGVLQAPAGESYAIETGDTHFYFNVANGYLYDGYRTGPPWSTGLLIFDIHSGGPPQIVGQIQTGDPIPDLHVIGDIGVMAAHDIAFWNLKEPSLPRLITEIDLPGVCNDVAMQGTRVYAGFSGPEHDLGHVYLLDASDTEHPLTVASVLLSSNVACMGVSGDLVVVATQDGGLVTLVSTSPPAPQGLTILDEVFLFDTPILDLVVAGDIAFAVAYAGVVSLDLSNPAQIYELDRWSRGSSIWQLALLDHTLYAGTMDAGIAILDVSDPAHMTLIGTAPGDDFVNAVAVDHNGLYGGQYGGKITFQPRQCFDPHSTIGGRSITGPSTGGLVITSQPAGVTIRFSAMDCRRAELGVYDLRGHRLASFACPVASPGEQTVVWDGRDERGRRCPAGVYLVRVTMDRYRALTGKALLLN